MHDNAYLLTLKTSANLRDMQEFRCGLSAMQQTRRSLKHIGQFSKGESALPLQLFL